VISLRVEAFLVELKDLLGTCFNAKSAALAQILIKRNICHIINLQ
jgi:hypothetical protein